MQKQLIIRGKLSIMKLWKQMISSQERRDGIMSEAKLSKSIAKGVACALNTLLRIDANSASCIVSYQPKIPKELAEYRRKK